MLYPEGLKKSKWIKKVSLFLYQNQDLKRVTAFHATSEQEKIYLREFGLIQPIAVIPNAIDTNNFGLPNFEPKKGNRKVGFMGRITPIKNIEYLIKAWSQAEQITKEHELLIIGDGDKRYIDQLVKLTLNLKITNIKFTGFVSGEIQDNLLSELSYLILPSKSENFGMVVAEALWKGIPVIASKGTPWEELETHRCGWLINNDPSSLSQLLMIALKLDESERLEMGKRGHDLIIKKYTTNKIGKMMKSFYEWIINGGNKPAFVDYK
jgi:glycosyltransferase involved in cell wall biosynthesis